MVHFPIDDYTPHGYLDNPTHTHKLRQRGVVRSHQNGFYWHVPAFPGGYGGQHERYRAGISIGFAGHTQLAMYDSVTSPYQTKQLKRFVCRHQEYYLESEWQLVSEHVLHARLRLSKPTELSIHALYQRQYGLSGAWGESGLVGFFANDMLILQAFEDGEAFALWCDAPARALGVTPDAALAATWAAQPAPGLPADGFVATLGQQGRPVALHGVWQLDAPAERDIQVLFARGHTADAARHHLIAVRDVAATLRDAKIQQDDAFWATAPRLSGDWPAHWRRGLVYDLETLRMVVRQPMGIYQNVWDGMQIHAPRVVLAEAAIDSLLLGYANPHFAQQLLLNTFRDAPLPNVPCSREDGSYNMVAADGTVCGTGPNWGFPFLVARWLYDLSPNQAWLQAIFPFLSEYLEWWLKQRQAEDGGWFFSCSWESGQDDSPRFGPQPLGGGHPVRHIRPVDLYAALAHAADTLAYFAALLERPADQQHWQERAEMLTAATARLWNGQRWADFDARAGQFTTLNDIMLLTPLALRLPHQPNGAMQPDAALLNPDALVWPMFAWVAVEAAEAVGQTVTAATIAAAICERAYTFWDARQAAPDRTLPGIACEYWPLNGRCGGEGYGWGAFTTHLLLHTLVGLSPTEDGLHIGPNLPHEWRVAGRRYDLHLHWRDAPLHISIQPHDSSTFTLELNGQPHRLDWGTALHVPPFDQAA